VLRLRDKLKNSIRFGCYEKVREAVIGVIFGIIHKHEAFGHCPTAENIWKICQLYNFQSNFLLSFLIILPYYRCHFD